MDPREFEYILIREFTILVRIPRDWSQQERVEAEVFDVRTGVQLPAIYPELDRTELCRGYPIADQAAAMIVKSGQTVLTIPTADLSKVVNILDVKQRKLDSVVASSILDQVRKICDVLHNFLQVADRANPEERLWLSQQALTLVRKFSGRELVELENVVEWLSTRPGRE
jgi:hypothetical protein